MDVLTLISHGAVFMSLYFEVFFLLSYLGKPKESKENVVDFTPGVSIIVPCFNEEKTVVDTIRSIFALDYPREKLDILIIDDGSTDKTYKKVRKNFKNNPSIRIFRKVNGGKHTALNFGIEKAKNDFIGCLDADSFVDPQALKIIMSKFVDPTVMATIPSTVIHKPKNIIQRAQRAEYTYGNFMRYTLSLINSVYVTPGPFSFFRKEVFEKIGPYHFAHSTEDMEIAMRMQKNHMRIVHAEKAVVYTTGPDTAKKLYKQRVRWATGFIGNLRDYKKMLFNKKHGNLSLLVLPFISIATFSLMFLSGLTLWRISQTLYADIERISIVGFSFGEFNIFDWFYINPNTLSILAIFLLLYAVVATIIGKKLTSGKAGISFELFYMIVLYSIMYPVWVTKAIYNNASSSAAPWR